MSKIVPFRRRRRPSRWVRADSYGGARAPLRPARLNGWWFPAVVVVLSLAAGGAVFFWPTGTQQRATDSAVPLAIASDRETGRFGLCSGPVRITCVVDGDTIWYQGTKIRIADLDTPEVSKPECANEAALGRRATARMQALLNAGPFTLEPNPDGRSEDRYGRSLMLVTRGGASLGAVLVDEGLAEQWGGPKRAWC